MNMFRLGVAIAIGIASFPCAWGDDGPPVTADMLDRGVGLATKKKYPEAIKVFDEIIKISPQSDHAYYALCNRGDAYCMQGLYDKAQKDLDRAVAQSPDKESAYMHRATVDRKTGHDKQAAADLSKALAIMQKAGTKRCSNEMLSGLFEERAEVYKALGEKSLQQKDLETAAALKKQ